MTKVTAGEAGLAMTDDRRNGRAHTVTGNLSEVGLKIRFAATAAFLQRQRRRLEHVLYVNIFHDLVRIRVVIRLGE